MRSRVESKAKHSTSQSSKTCCLVLTSNMSLQVLPLRVLVSRQVIRERMDYKEHLAGKTRSELDILDRLAGRFVVQASELVVERFFGGEKLAAEEWERRRGEMSNTLINFLDGTAELTIAETSSCKSGSRKWMISDHCSSNVKLGAPWKFPGDLK